jgi:cardiolipin synthase
VALRKRKPASHLEVVEPHPHVRREAEALLQARWEKSKPLRIFALIATLAMATWIVAALFFPVLRYKLAEPPAAGITSEEFLRELQALTNGQLGNDVRIEPLPNGEHFYEAELQAIRGARQSVNLEAYIFQRGEVARRFLEALTEVARKGVEVRLVVDAMGSFSTGKSDFKSLREVGGQVKFYHSVRWNTWMRSNNRTHRELAVIDGRIGFIGGAGVADHWLLSKKNHPRWRDEMFRVTGEAVTALQGAFAENWLECSGELLSGDAFFPKPARAGASRTLTISSSPSQGGSTRARVLYQLMLASATRSIDITTPYFLPDDSLVRELLRARRRGVHVRVLVPGGKSDHVMTRASSRSKYGDLLLAGTEIYEYQPSMVHAKIMTVDSTWSIVGSTNFDNRSFGINDEVNLAALDPQLAGTLRHQFQQDLVSAHRVTYDEWKHRPVWQRGVEWFGWILERQQ